MKIKDQVCSLKLAIQLKKLGVKQNSFFAWRKFGYKWSAVDPLDLGKVRNFDKDSDISAFTVAELGEMLKGEYLPEYKSDWNKDGRHKDIDNGKNWFVEDFGIYEDTEANARAKMLVYLLENKLTTL